MAVDDESTNRKVRPLGYGSGRRLEPERTPIAQSRTKHASEVIEKYAPSLEVSPPRKFNHKLHKFS